MNGHLRHMFTFINKGMFYVEFEFEFFFNKEFVIWDYANLKYKKIKIGFSLEQYLVNYHIFVMTTKKFLTHFFNFLKRKISFSAFLSCCKIKV